MPEMRESSGIWVVTPTLNQLEWLKLCVASVRDQTCGLNIRVHHHVQDAGSSDGTVEYLQRHSEFISTVVSGYGKDYTFSYESEPDNGMYDAINRGWRKSTDEFSVLAHLNSDEQYLHGALALAIAFLNAHPETDILVGDVIVLDNECRYYCSRPVLEPTLYYTMVNTFSTFTAATFISRRRLLDGGWFFEENWRAVGDKAWMLSRLREKVCFRSLGVYMAAFVDTGSNLALSDVAREESKRLKRSAPWSLRCAAPILLAQYRLRKLFAGHYRLGEFGNSWYSRRSFEGRVSVWVEKPKSLWKNRLAKGNGVAARLFRLLTYNPSS
jgi:glycosyltransferase involved in cell wall biosynthesis